MLIGLGQWLKVPVVDDGGPVLSDGLQLIVSIVLLNRGGEEVGLL